MHQWQMAAAQQLVASTKGSVQEKAMKPSCKVEGTDVIVVTRSSALLAAAIVAHDGSTAALRNYVVPAV